MHKLMMRYEGLNLWWSPESTYTVGVLKKRWMLLEELKTKHFDGEIVIYALKKPANQGNNTYHKFRGSRFRGISRNGNSWQILLMLNRKKTYLGSLSHEEMAARAFDKAAI
jgi:hypothetical protein